MSSRSVNFLNELQQSMIVGVSTRKITDWVIALEVLCETRRNQKKGVPRAFGLCNGFLRATALDVTNCFNMHQTAAKQEERCAIPARFPLHISTFLQIALAHAMFAKLKTGLDLPKDRLKELPRHDHKHAVVARHSSCLCWPDTRVRTFDASVPQALQRQA